MSGDQPADTESGRHPAHSEQGRVFSTLSYVLMWWSSLIVVQAFALGQAFLPPLGRTESRAALLIMALAGFIFVIMLFAQWPTRP